MINHSMKHEKAKRFCTANQIDLVQQYRLQHATKVPARFQDCFINSTVGQREILSSSIDYKNHIYFPLIDCTLVELNERFPLKTLSLMKSISNIYPASENFLNINHIDDFIHHIDMDPNAVKNEFNVIESTLKSKSMNDIIQLLNELIPLSTALPQILKMIRDAITIPISQVTCERSFSKMKMIKNYLGNSMSDTRLSDLTALAVERNFSINYDKIVDKFANIHKNCRILLR